MKRKLFFLLERLKITPEERKVVAGLLILLVGLGLTNLWLSSNVPFNEKRYRELDKQFKKRTAIVKAKENKVMERYEPEEKTAPKTPAKSLSSTKTQPSKKNDSHKKQVPKAININKASQQALQALPGIGSVYAKRIVIYRKRHHHFKNLDELKKIKGIAQKRLDKLKPFVKLTD